MAPSPVRNRNFGWSVPFQGNRVTAAPQCGASDNDFSQQGDQACPKKSRLGTGSAKLRTKFNGPADIPATVTLFNGKKKTLIAYVNPQGAQPVVLRSKLKGKKGKN